MDNNYNQQNNPHMNNDYGNYGGPYQYGGNQEPQKAPNIFQQFVLSFVPTKYDRLIKVKTGSMIGFVTLLVLVSTILLFIGLFLPMHMSDWINEIPDFTIQGGKLSVEEEFMYDDGMNFIQITDDTESFSYDDAYQLALEGYRNIMLVGQNGMSVMQNGQYQQLNFADFSSLAINKSALIDALAPIMTFGIIIVCIIFFVGRTFWYFICAAVYLLFAMLIAYMLKKQYEMGTLFRTAVYSKVLMYVVETLLNMVPFAFLSVPFALRAVITVVFMGYAIMKLPESGDCG
ncbi:MAG: DUF1189 domain-containing protein [Bacillus sp. (in: Bacteria)]|nr:DUF1189 domain-containing protein [Bacillus sp. (in: firmicutes)]MCM1427908.1 DUF1189 domain-containing protein [Eubacterium sp.]